MYIDSGCEFVNSPIFGRTLPVMQSAPEQHSDRPGGRAAGIAAIAAVTALVALFLSHPQGGVFQDIVAIAAWMRGGATPDVVTWPAWGYPVVLAFVQSFRLVLVLQAAMGVLALAALFTRLRHLMPQQGLLLAILCVLAVPWHYTQVTLYPHALAGSLCLLALLAIDRAILTSSAAAGVVAGVLMGLAQNFRTEFVILPLFLLACSLGLRRVGLLKARSLRPMAVFVAVALLLQLPWAVFYHAHTGRYSLTESNLGHVLYVSLGSQPANPWEIHGDDLEAQKAVNDLGYSFSSLSDQGSRVLVRLTIDKIKQHPSGLMGRTYQQFRNTVLAPFNWGEPKLDERHAKNLDVLRQELKARLGVGVNTVKLSDYRSRGLYSQAIHDQVALLALLYQVLAVGMGSILFMLGLFGIVIVLYRPADWAMQSLVWLCGLVVLYKVAQDVLLCYQLNYLNNVYPMFLPFVAIGLTVIVNRVRQPAAASPGRANSGPLPPPPSVAFSTPAVAEQVPLRCPFGMSQSRLEYVGT